VRAGHESVCGCECVSVRVPLSLCVFARAGLSARVRGCAAASMRMCVFACVFARICVRAFVCVRRSVCARACACARGCACVRSCGCASVFGRSIGKHLCACVCVRARACACVRGTTVCARLGAEWALWGPAVRIARPAAAGRARLRIGATGLRRRARLPQAEPSAAAPSRRDGMRDMGTRRWSTKPAPSTSSAANTAPPPPATRTSGRAAAEVRGPDSVGGLHWVGTTGVLRGY
jgi:hypothetical protein